MTSAARTPAREQWLTLQEACALVGVSPATLRRWSDNGDISTFTTPGGHRRFAKSAILGLLPVPSCAPEAAHRTAAEAPVAADAHGAADASPALLALVAQASEVPMAEREAFAVELEALERSAATLVLHTCHRVELYVALDAFTGQPLPEPPQGSRRLQGDDAARHLISVACGLQSAVLCENQLLHQLRETFAQRRASHPLHPILDRLFQVALQAGRRARSRLGSPRRSLADVALTRIEEQAGPIQSRQILIVGAGVMGRLGAFAAARLGGEVIVTSPTAERAGALAREVGGRTIPFAGRQALPSLAAAIVALRGKWSIAEEDARTLASSGAIVVDMSSPMAVPDGLRAALGERFVSTDDLAWESGMDEQDGLRRRLEQLVAQSADSYLHWLRTRDAAPVIQAIGETAEERRREELQWLFRRLSLAEDERSLIEQMSRRLVADILHAPRSALGTDGSGRLAQAARELFGA